MRPEPTIARTLRMFSMVFKACRSSVMASAGKAIFWKDQKVVAGLLARWSPDAIATATVRLAGLERAFKRSGSPGMVLVGEELLAISRAAAARRRR